MNGRWETNTHRPKKIFLFVVSIVVHFLSRERKPNQKKTPMSRFILRVAKPYDEAAPHTAMLCCIACSGAHNLTIAGRLASLYALPGGMMLAALPGLCGRSARKLTLLSAGLRQSAHFYPSVPSMLGAGKWGAPQKLVISSRLFFKKGDLRLLTMREEAHFGDGPSKLKEKTPAISSFLSPRSLCTPIFSGGFSF